ncbi:MAG: penicillin-insensitive murein endopeptidase [Myxococcota bacterium]
MARRTRKRSRRDSRTTKGGRRSEGSTEGVRRGGSGPDENRRSDSYKPGGDHARHEGALLLALWSLVAGSVVRGAGLLAAIVARTDWRRLGGAAGRFLSLAASAAARAVRACLRALIRAVQSGLSRLWGVDWRGLAALAAGAIASAARRLLAIARAIPSFLAAATRAVFVLVKAAAMVALTLLLSTLFAGAVLLASGQGSSSERIEQRQAPQDMRDATTQVEGDDSLSLARSSSNDSHVPGADAATSPSTQSPAPRGAAASSGTPAGPAGRGQKAASESGRGDSTSINPDESLVAPVAPPSCSAGTRVSGPLLHAERLPDEGPGHARVFPHRDLAYGTDELVGAIERAAEALADPELPPLMVGNLSGPRGDQAGADPFHPARFASGQGAGRAGDLLFFVRDALGRPVPAAETNIVFDGGGRSRAGVRRMYLPEAEPIPPGCHLSRRRSGLTEAACPVPASTWRIDFDRTWELVRALLTDPIIGAVDMRAGVARADGQGIRFIFVDEAIKRGILSAGRRAGEGETMLQIAGVLLHEPSNSSIFERFMRIDLWCSEEDRRTCGCEDGSGPWRRWPEGAPVEAAGDPPARRIAAAGG